MEVTLSVKVIGIILSYDTCCKIALLKYFIGLRL